MDFTLVHRHSCRVRLRFTAPFTPEQGEGLCRGLLQSKAVTLAQANPQTKSLLLVTTSPKVYPTLLRTLKKLSWNMVKPQPLSTATMMANSDLQFGQDLAFLVSRHYLTKWFLPTVLRPYYQWIKGIFYIKEGISSLLKRKITVEVLDATAIGVSLLRKDYTTASSTMFLLGLSDILLGYSNARAKNQLAQSLTITTSTVWRVTDGKEEQIPMESLSIGDVIRLRQGSLVPVDGTILAGDGSLNESTMTGEPLPVHKEKDASVFAGTVLEEGEIDLVVRSLGSQTRIAQIVHFIQNGEESKAEIQGNAEQLADRIVPYSFGLFFATWFFSQNLTRALSVLMVDFSCAIKLTTPIAVISALKEGAEENIVVKGGKYLELLSQVDLVVFDKTGTLTKAVPQVVKVLSVHPDYSEEDVLRHAACLEEHFPHSVASAIVKEAEEQGLPHPEFHEKVEYIVAHGIVTSNNGVRSCIGSGHFLFEDENISYPEEKAQWLQEEIGSHSAVYLAVGGELVGVLCIHDPPRPEAKEVISGLRDLGISNIIMLTGDTPSTAKYVAEELGLDDFKASVLPDGKAKIIEEYKAKGHTVLMVGDGINDAPALSCANVSMTLAGSSDIARETADISILSEDLRDILKARTLSTGLMHRISHHYRMIVGFNGSLLVCGMFGLLTAGQNAFLHNLSTLGFAGLSTKKLLKEEKNPNF